MEIIVVKDYSKMSKVAANLIAEEVKANPQAVLGLATGGTPEGIYRELVNMNKTDNVDFSEVTTVNLDEYIGLPGDHPQSYRYFMDDKLFNHININKERTFVPNGLAADINEEGKNYDKMIDGLGGIDIQLLGIGNNGHIAFNEPDEYLVAGTHLTSLTENTIKANARFFDSIDEVPTTAITMGLGQIMKSKKILMVASGEGKAKVVKGLVSGKITPLNPATMLQMHRDVTLVIDEVAARLIK